MQTKQAGLKINFSLIYPILAGFFGFLATVIGSHFFRSTQTVYYIALGILLFLASNHMLYKLKFNSYHKNGSTVTTILVFTAQATSMAIYKLEQIGWKWGIGVMCILIGTIIIQSDKPKQSDSSTQQQIKNNQKQL